MENKPRYKLVKRKTNNDTKKQNEPTNPNIPELITSIKRSLYGDIDARAKYWMEQRIGLLLNNNALMQKNTTELKIDYDNNSGGLSWLFKYNGSTVAYIDNHGFLYCSNILLNGVNLLNAVNNIVSINQNLNNLNDLFVRHTDLKNGTYVMNIEDITTTKETIQTKTSEEWNCPFVVLAPNMTSNQNVLIKLGKNENDANCGYVAYNWSGDSNTDNFISIGQQGYDHLYRFYHDRCEFHNGLIININDATNPALRLLNSSTGSISMYIGKELTDGNCGIIRWNHSMDGNGNQKNYLGLMIYGSLIDLIKCYFNKVEIIGLLTVMGNMSIHSNETITGDVSIGGNETITGDVSIGGNETITGDVSIGGHLYLNNTIETPLVMYNTAENGGDKWIRIGVNDTAKNNLDFGFKYVGSGSDDNCAVIRVGDVDILRCYYNRSQILKPLSIDGDTTITGVTNVISDADIPLKATVPTLANGTSKMIGITDQTKTAVMSLSKTSDGAYQTSLKLLDESAQLTVDATTITTDGKLETTKTTPTDAFGPNFQNMIFQLIYPIGSIYVSYDRTGYYIFENRVVRLNKFGCVFELLPDGVFLRNNKYAVADAWGEGTYHMIEWKSVGWTGGEEYHTLTVDEMPSHTHVIDIHGSGEEAAGFGAAAGSPYFGNRIMVGGTPRNLTYSTGKGEPHENCPPFKTVYMWERVA